MEKKRTKVVEIPSINLIWHKDLKDMDIPPPSWRVDGLISKQGITAISGLPGTHKTWFAFDIAVCVAQGIPLFGRFETERCKALIVDEESGLGRIKLRLSLLSEETLDIATASEQHFKISPDLAKSIIKSCDTNDIGLVIFDSLTCFHNVNENSSNEMAGVLECFQLIAQAGIAVILIHHEPKISKKNPSNASLRGSGDILAKCDVHISLSHGEHGSNNRIKVMQMKSRDSELLPDFELVVKKNDDESRLWFEHVGESLKIKSKDELAEQAIFAYLEEYGRSGQSDIIESLNSIAGETKVATLLKDLAASSKLELSTGARGKRFFDLPKEQTNE